MFIENIQIIPVKFRCFLEHKDNNGEPFFSSSLFFSVFRLARRMPLMTGWWRGRMERSLQRCFFSFFLAAAWTESADVVKQEMSTNSQNASRDQKQLPQKCLCKRETNIMSEYSDLFRSKVLDSKEQRDVRVATAATQISSTAELWAGLANSWGASRLREHSSSISQRRDAVLHSSVFPDCVLFCFVFLMLCLCRSLAFLSWRPVLDRDSMWTWRSPPWLSEFWTLGAASVQEDFITRQHKNKSAVMLVFISLLD